MPQYYFGKKCTYLLDLDKFQTPVNKIGDLCNDAYGMWKSGGSKDFFFKERPDGEGYQRIGTMRQKPREGEWDLLVHEYRLYHTACDPRGGDGKLSKKIYAVFDHNKFTSEGVIAGRWAAIVYEWRGRPFDILGVLPMDKSGRLSTQDDDEMFTPSGANNSVGFSDGSRKRRFVSTTPEEDVAKRELEMEVLELEKQKLKDEMEMIAEKRELIRLQREWTEHKLKGAQRGEREAVERVGETLDV